MISAHARENKKFFVARAPYAHIIIRYSKEDEDIITKAFKCALIS